MADSSKINRSRPMARQLAKSAGIHIKSSHEGRLHKNLKVKSGDKIPLSKLEAAKHSKSASVRKQATFAMNARNWRH